jgi:hypothetical protein
MSFKVLSISLFDKQAKRLVKKYPSLKSEIAFLAQSLSSDPIQGTSLKNNFYKIRLSIRSKGKGKSGGARVITYVKIINETIYLVSIYDKSERETISDQELDSIFKSIL